MEKQVKQDFFRAMVIAALTFAIGYQMGYVSAETAQSEEDFARSTAEYERAVAEYEKKYGVKWSL